MGSFILSTSINWPDDDDDNDDDDDEVELRLESGSDRIEGLSFPLSLPSFQYSDKESETAAPSLPSLSLQLQPVRRHHWQLGRTDGRKGAAAYGDQYLGGSASSLSELRYHP